MNLLDALLLVYLVFGAWRGFRSGLLPAAGGFCGFLAGIWFAGHYYVPLAHYIGDGLGLKNFFAQGFSAFFQGVPCTSSEIGAMPGAEAGSPAPLWEPWLGLQTGVGNEVLGQLMAGAVVKFLAFLVIWLVVWKLLAFFSFWLSKIVHLLPLGSFDRLAGAGLELFLRSGVLVVLAGFVNPLLQGIPSGVLQTIINIWETSMLVPFLLARWLQLTPVLEHLLGII